MGAGLYLHIPYCIQRCPYCDFATYEQHSILPQADYVELLCQEIQARCPSFEVDELVSVYFGGGTPSLLSSSDIVKVLKAIENSGLKLSSKTEVTIEINPGTLVTDKILELKDGGVNRFSVGAQTFSESRLKDIGREHTAQDTRETLELLAKLNLNYSFDLMFALPNQTLSELELDLVTLGEFSPNHVSIYNLTVAEKNPLYSRQPNHELQADMLAMVEEKLPAFGLHQYEISNFAKLGFESKHNSLYWQDDNYLGLGLSSHSYLKDFGDYGSRFWNPKQIGGYEKFVRQTCRSEWSHPASKLEPKQIEQLSLSESKTDYIYTHLRTASGISLDKFSLKYGEGHLQELHDQLRGVPSEHYSITPDGTLKLTQEGFRMSNQVFEIICVSN